MDGSRRSRRQQVRSLTKEMDWRRQAGRWIFKITFGRQKRQNNSVGKPKCAGEAGINKVIS